MFDAIKMPLGLFAVLAMSAACSSASGPMSTGSGANDLTASAPFARTFEVPQTASVRTVSSSVSLADASMTLPAPAPGAAPYGQDRIQPAKAVTFRRTSSPQKLKTDVPSLGLSILAGAPSYKTGPAKPVAEIEAAELGSFTSLMGGEFLASASGKPIPTISRQSALLDGTVYALPTAPKTLIAK